MSPLGNRGQMSTKTMTIARTSRHRGSLTVHDRDTGAAIVMALLVVVLILLLGAVLVSETLASSHNAALTSKSVQVVSAARAGTSAGIASVETALAVDNTGGSQDLTCQSIASTSNYNGDVGAANGAGNAVSAGWYTLYWGLATGPQGTAKLLAETEAESAATGASLPWQPGGNQLSYGTCGTGSPSTMIDSSTLLADASTDTTIWIAFEAVGQTASPVFQNSAGKFQGADTSVATVKLSDNPVCAICLLGGGASDMLLSEGGANLDVSGGVIYDSSPGTPAASTSGGGTVSATAIDVVGTTQGSGFTPSPTTGISPWGDAGLQLPPPPSPIPPITGADLQCPTSCTKQIPPGNYGNITANGTLTIGSPSCTSTNYDSSSCITYIGGLSVGSHADLTLGPGIYVFEGGGASATPYTGGFTVQGGGTVIANGVMLYFTCSTGSCAPDSLGGYASFLGGSYVTLSPQCRTCGNYGGISIYQDPNDLSPMTLAGNSGTDLTGTIYAPGAAVDLVGTSDAIAQNIQLDVSSVTTSGNGTFLMQDNTDDNYTNWHALVQTIN